MSDLANWSYTAKATIWRCIGEDEYSKKTFSGPEIITCDYGMEASNKLNNIGLGFAVKNTFWTEYDKAKVDDYILFGESIEVDPIKAGADRIRHIIRYADTFGRLADDFTLITAV
ncbi:hypothetical protein RHO12_03160 [Orbus sturtevantii]|uniref:hypothetical protein n=1 Tax=Orbus sturtevantii TaxID=3074109 RepID=UPI00370D4E5E